MLSDREWLALDLALWVWRGRLVARYGLTPAQEAEALARHRVFYA